MNNNNPNRHRSSKLANLREFLSKAIQDIDAYSSTEFYYVRSEYYQSILDHTAYTLSKVYGSKQVSLLDILPTSGDYLIGITERLDNLSLFAFELSMTIKDHVRGRLERFGLENGVSFVLADEKSAKLEIPLPDESVDCVTCFNRLNLVPDASDLLSEIGRVLKKRGLLIISNVNRLSPTGINLTLKYHVRQGPLSRTRHAAVNPLKPLSARNILLTLRQNGFQTMALYGLNTPRTLYYRLLSRIFSNIGDADRSFRYQYSIVSSFWESDSLLSHLANVNFISAIKV